MFEFAMAFAGAFVGALAALYLLPVTKKQAVKLKEYRRVAKSPTEPSDPYTNTGVKDWLYHKPEAAK